MDLVTLYEEAIKGVKSALNELKSYAGAGNAQAQYLLSCIYDNPDYPFQNVSLGMYWLKRSAENGSVDARRKIEGLTSDIKHQYELDDVKLPNMPQGVSHNTGYTPNWTRPENKSYPPIDPNLLLSYNNGSKFKNFLMGLLGCIILTSIRCCTS